MLQQFIALLFIIFFLSRLFWQKKKNQINVNEFIFWLVFWTLAGVAILALKWIDKLTASLGFSSAGIDVLLYLGVLGLFYIIFRIRIRLAKIEKELTLLVREIALKNKK